MECFAVPSVLKVFGVKVSHMESSVMVEAAGGEVSVVSDVAFGERRPARERCTHCVQSTRVACHWGSIIVAAGEPCLAV